MILNQILNHIQVGYTITFLWKCEAVKMNPSKKKTSKKKMLGWIDGWKDSRKGTSFTCGGSSSSHLTIECSSLDSSRTRLNWHFKLSDDKVKRSRSRCLTNHIQVGYVITFLCKWNENKTKTIRGANNFATTFSFHLKKQSVRFKWTVFVDRVCFTLDILIFQAHTFWEWKRNDLCVCINFHKFLC